MKVLCLILFNLIMLSALAQNKTASSLYLKKDQQQLQRIESKTGNLFHKLGHHGPAVENQWLGLRYYFSKKSAIDLYSKAKPQMELADKKWYPGAEDQQNGWGADYYKVGNTLGLGGVWLWDGKKAVRLHPVDKRVATVKNTADYSLIEVTAHGVPYKKEKVDIAIRITVSKHQREAEVTARCTSGQKVQFVTGINYFKNLELTKAEKYIASWGIHPEDVAAEKVMVGAAILFNSDDFVDRIDDGKQIMLVSGKTDHLSTIITACNSREEELNSNEKFIAYLNRIEIKTHSNDPE